MAPSYNPLDSDEDAPSKRLTGTGYGRAGGTGYRDHERPSPAILFKAALMSFTTMYTYYTVISELTKTSPKTFIPCNDNSCHYIKIFGAAGIPGTGSDVMQIQNGQPRPFFLHDYAYDVDTEYYINCSKKENKAFEESKDHYVAFHKELKRQKKEAASMAMRSKIAFWICKTAFRIWVVPFSYLSRLVAKEDFGVKYVKPAICPKKSSEEMKKMCDSEEMKARIDVSGLQEGHALKTFYVCLFAWSIVKSIHDWGLVRDWAESKTLLIGQFATLVQGGASGAVFFWSLAGFSVFGAKVPDEISKVPGADCMCYYQMPVLAACLALATPFSLLILFVGKVQAVGMSILYGDYFYFARYDVPAYLVKQSKMWTWGTLVTPWVAGTPQLNGPSEIENKTATIISRKQEKVHPRLFMERGSNSEIGTPLTEDEKVAYRRCYFAQQVLIGSRMLVWFVPVSLSAAAAVLRGRELLTEFMRKDEDPVRHWLLKIVFVFPTLFVVGYSCIFLCHTWIETLPEYLKVNRKWFKAKFGFDLETKATDSNNTTYKQNNSLRWLIFIPMCIVVAILATACAFGLTPDWQVMAPWVDAKPERPELMQAELWAASGFVLCILPMQMFFFEIFSVREDMLKLDRLLAMSDDKRRLNQDMAASTNLKGFKGLLEAADKDKQDYDGFGFVVDEFGNTDFMPDKATPSMP
jgi:hypothetical protein